MTMALLDEKALRKPSFSEGYAVTLADGQDWTFPKPSMRLYPIVGDDGTIDVGGSPSYGRDLDKMLDAVLGGDEVSDFDRLKLQFRIAYELLAQNYDIPASELKTVLAFTPDDPESVAMWGRINRMLVGVPLDPDESPKP